MLNVFMVDGPGPRLVEVDHYGFSVGFLARAESDLILVFGVTLQGLRGFVCVSSLRVINPVHGGPRPTL